MIFRQTCPQILYQIGQLSWPVRQVPYNLPVSFHAAFQCRRKFNSLALTQTRRPASLSRSGRRSELELQDESDNSIEKSNVVADEGVRVRVAAGDCFQLVSLLQLQQIHIVRACKRKYKAKTSFLFSSRANHAKHGICVNVVDKTT